MQLLFPLSLPPLQNASAPPDNWLSTKDSRLKRVRQALKNAGLGHSRLIARSAESESLQSALAHELWLQKHFSLARPDQANALMCIAEEPPKPLQPDFSAVGEAAKSNVRKSRSPKTIRWLLRPVHFSLALDHLVLAVDAPERLRLDDATKWLELLREALEPGWQLESWVSPRLESLFVLSLPSPMDWAPKSSTQATGRSIDRYLPTGHDARAWRRFLNHAQMLLHEHPLNTERELQGQTSINGFWLEGELEQMPSTLFRSSMSSILNSSKLSLAAKSDGTEPKQANLDQQNESVILIDDWITPTHQGDIEAWCDTWQRLASFIQDLPKTKPLMLNFFGEAAQLCIESRPNDRWRIWRLGALI